jgi:hypothetical protein
MAMGTAPLVALFTAGSMRGRCQPVMAPHSIVPGNVGDVGPLGMAYHGYSHVEACPPPSGVGSLTPDSSFYVYDSWRRSWAPMGPVYSGEVEPVSLGSGEMG